MLVIGAPNNFTPAVLGAEECPNTGSAGLCSSPVTDIASSNGTYSFTLSPGAYHMAGFYELMGGGPRFQGIVENVTVTSGKTTSTNLPVPYAKPATLAGKVTVTMVPKSDPVKSDVVLVCPSNEPYTGGTPASDCVSKGTKATSKTTNSGISASANYSVPDFPAGSYLAYPGYCALSGCATSTSGVAVTLTANKTTTQNLKTTFLMGNQGLIFGKVSITGAPNGFTAQTGATACNVETSACQVAYQTTGDYNLILPAGSYNVRGFYLSGNTFVYGSPVPEVLTAGSTIHKHLTTAYQAPPAVSHK